MRSVQLLFTGFLASKDPANRRAYGLEGGVPRVRIGMAIGFLGAEPEARLCNRLSEPFWVVAVIVLVGFVVPLSQWSKTRFVVL